MYTNAPILAVALLSQLVAAQTTTSAAPAASGSSLPELVDQIDDCVLRCVSQLSSQIGCAATDFACLCSSSPDNLQESLTPCVLSSGCIVQDALDSAEIVPLMCAAVANDPSPAEVSSASAIVEEAASETGGGSSDEEEDENENEDDDSASSHLIYGAHGLLAAMAAFVLA
jgi:hypothetical protein